MFSQTFFPKVKVEMHYAPIELFNCISKGSDGLEVKVIGWFVQYLQ